MKVPHCYVNRANAIIDTFWTKTLDKGRMPQLSKAQIRQHIARMVEQCTLEDGDPATWTPCNHCEGGIYYTRPTADEERAPDFLDKVNHVGLIGRGMCYQCLGKGYCSPADRRRNAGHQWHRERADFEIEAMRGK
jgi:hypothetical protein